MGHISLATFSKKKKKKNWKLKNKFYFSSPTFYLWTWDNHTDTNFTISLVLKGLKILAVENPEYLNNFIYFYVKFFLI